MGKILFINRYYAPDHSATSQLLTSLAEYLANDGLNIHVVTSTQLYEDPGEILPKIEKLNGVVVHRIYSSRFGRNNLLGRAIDYLTFYISAFIFLLSHVEQQDFVVAKTDPPLISVIAGVVVKYRRAKLVNWTQDLFPEVVRAISPRAIPSPLYVFLKKLRNWSLRIADKNIVIGEIMRQQLQKNGVKDERLKVINNWYVGSQIIANYEELEMLKREWGLSGKFVVEYSGNLGRAHEYEIFFKAAEKLSGVNNLVFLFIGGGTNMNKLKETAVANDVKNIIFKPYQPLARLNLSLQIADVHLVTLAPRLEGLVVPSKFYGILASGKPIIFIGSSDGELALVIKEHGCGLSVLNEDYIKLSEEIVNMQSSMSRYESAEIRNIHEKYYSFDVVSKQWLSIFRD